MKILIETLNVLNKLGIMRKIYQFLLLYMSHLLILHIFTTFVHFIYTLSNLLKSIWQFHLPILLILPIPLRCLNNSQNKSDF